MRISRHLMYPERMIRYLIIGSALFLGIGIAGFVWAARRWKPDPDDGYRTGMDGWEEEQ
jgi:hypothetical protein